MTRDAECPCLCLCLGNPSTGAYSARRSSTSPRTSRWMTFGSCATRPPSILIGGRRRLRICACFRLGRQRPRRQTLPLLLPLGWGKFARRFELIPASPLCVYEVRPLQHLRQALLADEPKREDRGRSDPRELQARVVCDALDPSAHVGGRIGRQSFAIARHARQHVHFFYRIHLTAGTVPTILTAWLSRPAKPNAST